MVLAGQEWQDRKKEMRAFFLSMRKRLHRPIIVIVIMLFPFTLIGILYGGGKCDKIRLLG